MSYKFHRYFDNFVSNGAYTFYIVGCTEEVYTSKIKCPMDCARIVPIALTRFRLDCVWIAPIWHCTCTWMAHGLRSLCPMIAHKDYPLGMDVPLEI